ncbi:MAG: hypothetical protein ACYC55_01210 [Candidatus Geothermincolia bacterium]
MKKPYLGSHGKLEYFYRSSDGRSMVFIARDGYASRRHAPLRTKAHRNVRLGKIAPGH